MAELRDRTQVAGNGLTVPQAIAAAGSRARDFLGIHPAGDIVTYDDDPREDAYLRLHLLSARLVQPHGLNVEGIFGQLQKVAWTDLGSVHPGDLADPGFAGLNDALHA